MSINELHMRPGDWDLQLSVDTPLTLRQNIGYGAVVYITPSYQPLVDADSVRTAATYAGLVTRRGVRAGRYAGPGLAGFVTTGKAESAYIPDFAGLPPLPFTMSSFMATMFGTGGGLSNGLVEGDDYFVTGTQVVEYDLAELPGLYSALQYVAEVTGNQWRITPQGGVDYGNAHLGIYPIRAHDTTPGLAKVRKILITPEAGGYEAAGWQILEPTSWDPTTDIDDYRNSSVVFNASETAPTARQANNGAPTFRHLTSATTAVYNNTKRIVAPSDTAGDIVNLAQAAANYYARPSYDFDAQVALDHPAGHYLVPGDALFVYDPIEGIVGDVHIPIPGMAIAPLVINVAGVQWPIADGYGVWAVDANDRDRLFDLTPYVEWETGDTAIALGSLPKSGYLGSVQSLIE